MASVPDPMSGSNWMMRRMVIDSVRNDPAGRAATTPNNRRNCVSPAHGLRWQRSGAKSACRSWLRTMKWRMPLSISAWRTSRSDNDAPLIGGAAARANDRFNHLLWVPCCTRLGPLPALTRPTSRTFKANSEGSNTVPRRADATPIQPQSRVPESCSFARPYKLNTELTWSSGPENIGPERMLLGPLAPVPALILCRITPENNGKIRPKPDRENAFARATGGRNATAVEPSPPKSLI